MTGETFPTRVKFTDRQFLQATDLRAEQRYHREQRWRHNRGLHSWGVVAGLQVETPVAGCGPVTVHPGMALDGYGRELVVPYPLSSPTKVDRDTAYDVWLVYAESESPRRAGGSGRCPGPDEAPNRTEEKPRVLVTPRTDRQSPDPARPDPVPLGDLDFGPDRPAPEPGGSPWPVFLAGVEYRDDEWQVAYDERRYAGLVADRIESRPHGDEPQAGARTVILNGADRAWSSYRFAVITAPPGTEPTPEDTPPALAVRALPQPEKTAGKDRVPNEAVAACRVELRANRVAVAGDLTLRNGSALEFAPNPIGRQDDHAGLPIGSEFWRIYHHFQPPNGAEDTEYSDELRITMPDVPAGTNRVAIGCVAADGKFTPVLAVKADKSVEVYGNLVVNGKITGNVTEAPATAAGAADGGVSLREMETTVRAYLAQPGAARFREVLDAVTGVAGATDQLTEYLINNPPALDSRRLAESWWEKSALVAPLGTASTKATAGQHGTFRGFLDKLDTLSGAGTPKALTEIGTWVFDQHTSTDPAANLATGFPPEQTDPLKKFAETLVEAGNANRLTALIDALIDAAGAKAIITRLVAKKQDEEMVKQLFTTDNHRTANFEAAGKLLTAAGEHRHVQALLRGVAAATATPPGGGNPAEASLDVLAAELLDDKWLPPTSVGRAAAARALASGLDASPTVDNTRNKRLGQFFKFVKDRANEGDPAPDDPLAEDLEKLRQACKDLRLALKKVGPKVDQF